MSLNEIIHSARSGLTASQAGLRSVSNNIANVSTTGYARQRVSLSSDVSNGRVAGVIVGEPSRVADKFLENAVYQRGGAAGRSDAVASYMDRLQALLGAPSSASGLAARIGSLSSAAAEITSLQGSEQTVSLFTTNVSDTINTINTLQKDVATLRADAATQVGYTIDRANVLLRQVYDANEEVSRLEGLGRSTSGPADLRVSALEELSQLMDINVREHIDGRVSIEASSGQLLLDKRLRQLSYPAGTGVSQDNYPPIEVRFADANGVTGAATGERIESAAVGGQLGGLIDIRDRALPGFSEKLGVLFSGIAQSLNAVSNDSTTLPPPRALTGQPNGLIGTDRLGFTGKAVVAVVGADGMLVRKLPINFDALGPTATVDDAVAAINAGLAPHGSATFADGRLSISATGSNGIAIAQDPTGPSDRGGVGFSQFFGLNNLIHSDTSALAPSGFQTTDPHGFTTGQTASIALRDASGKLLATHTLTMTTGGTFGDLIDQLNAPGSPLSDFGDFRLDPQGRVRFDGTGSNQGSVISIPSDSTNRAGTGLSFSALSGLSGTASGLNKAQVRTDIVAKPGTLPLARLQVAAAEGTKAVGKGDLSGANAFIDKLATGFDFGKDGNATVSVFAGNLLGGTGTSAALAATELEGATARFADAVNRRDNYAGVDVDEELAMMVVLQNSYSAAARVMTTATQMYDTLLEMMR